MPGESARWWARGRNCSDDLGSFEDAIEAASDNDRYDGVGFVFTTNDPFTGIDLDDCIDESGGLVPEAQEIVDSLASYTEVSPSGKGVKIFVEGRKPEGVGCRTKKVIGFREIEVYDNGRYFTVTGRHLPETSLMIEPRQKQLDVLCRRFWPPKKSAIIPRRSDNAVFNGDDETLIKRACNAKNGDKFRRLWNGETSMHGDDDSAADMAMCCLLAFWTGCDPVRMERLFRQSGLYREKWDRVDYRERTIKSAIANCHDTYTPPRCKPQCLGSTSNGVNYLPEVLLGPDEHRVADEVIEILANDEGLYQRGDVLVRVLSPRELIDGEVVAGIPTIKPVIPAHLRDRITRHVRLLRIDKDGDEVLAHPTPWLVRAIDARGEWPGIRPLLGVVDAPILRQDGSIMQQPGYDARTGVLYAPNCDFPAIADDVDIDDAQAARDELLEVVQDFRFEDPAHQSAWLSSLLTPIARYAFDGPSPLFLVDANVRGAGKGLLVGVASRIALGHEVAVTTFSQSEEEMRKHITAMALAGDRIILLDNLEGTLGNAALDRALTTTRWKDRMLGFSRIVDQPMLATWFATGNNVTVKGDTVRRTIHIRLDVLDERPELRSDFKHPNLLQWVAAERPRLYIAALTILRAYFRAGRPNMTSTPLGSFEGWSSLVRDATVWVGLPDPYDTRLSLQPSTDLVGPVLRSLHDAWAAWDPSNNGVVLGDLVRTLYGSDLLAPPTEVVTAMKTALEDLLDLSGDRKPTARQIGSRLRNYRRRVMAGRYLDIDSDAPSRRGAVWRLYKCETGQ